MRRSAISAFYFVVLQVLWVFRLIYETILPENALSTEPSSPNQHENPTKATEKRHLIHLFTTTPKQINERPICYMHVCQIISPREEEMLRCACAKGLSKIKSTNENEAEETAFTNVWMESFSLVA